jgi:opacity protein-like surface antigen
MKKWLLSAAVVALLTVPAGEAQAQVAFGPQVVLFDFEDIGIGGRVDFGLGEAFGIQEGMLQGLFGSGNVNYVLAEGDATQLLFNLNVGVPIPTAGALRPYAGAGLNHNRVSVSGFSASSSGLNVLGGLFLDVGLPAFVELQYSTTGAGFLSLSVGLLFGR